MENKPYTSVIVPVYNGERFLREQLDSIINQITTNDELIIIDDASNDNSVKIIESYTNANIIKIQNYINIGIQKTLEKGIRIAKNPIITFADQDDIWLPGKLKEIKTTFSNEKIDLFLQDGLMIDQNKQLLNLNPISWVINYGKGLFSNFIKNSFLGCCMSLRREFAIKYLRGLPYAPMHDYYFGTLILLFKRNYKISHNISFLFRRHSSNQTPEKTSLFDKIQTRGKLLLSLYFALKYDINN